MQAQAAFVGADAVVELNAVAAVDLILTVIVNPADPELDLPVRLNHPL